MKKTLHTYDEDEEGIAHRAKRDRERCDEVVEILEARKQPQHEHNAQRAQQLGVRDRRLYDHYENGEQLAHDDEKVKQVGLLREELVAPVFAVREDVEHKLKGEDARHD